VLQATVEAQRDLLERGLFRAGLAAFVDAARAWQRSDATASPLHVDVGIGVRLRVSPGQPAIRIDVARGLRDGRTAVSAGITIENLRI
jgi:outer membrane translocation and assembly module TamA